MGERAWFSRRRVLAVGGVAVLLLVAILLAPTPLVNPLARRIVSGYGNDCAELSGFRVDSGRWPVVLRAVTGRLSDASVEIDEVRFDTFAVYDVSTEASEVEVAPLGLSVFGRDVKVRGGETSSTMLFEDIERLYAENDIVLTLRREDQRLIADIEVPVLGPVPTTVEIVPVDGDLEVSFAPFDFFVLPPVRITSAEPFSVQTVEIQDDALRVSSTFEGTVRAEDFACDVTTD